MEKLSKTELIKKVNEIMAEQMQKESDLEKQFSLLEHYNREILLILEEAE